MIFVLKTRGTCSLSERRSNRITQSIDSIWHRHGCKVSGRKSTNLTFALTGKSKVWNKACHFISFQKGKGTLCSKIIFGGEIRSGHETGHQIHFCFQLHQWKTVVTGKCENWRSFLHWNCRYGDNIFGPWNLKRVITHQGQRLSVMNSFCVQCRLKADMFLDVFLLSQPFGERTLSVKSAAPEFFVDSEISMALFFILLVHKSKNTELHIQRKMKLAWCTDEQNMPGYAYE